MASLSLSQKELREHYFLSTRKTGADCMLKGEIVSILLLIDDLTLHLIGWTDQITLDTFAFLASTKSITAKQVEEEISKQYL